MMTNTTFQRPFPALTPAERYCLDVYGYVVIEQVLGEEEIQRLHDAVCRLRDELLATPDPSKAMAVPAFYLYETSVALCAHP